MVPGSMIDHRKNEGWCRRQIAHFDEIFLWLCLIVHWDGSPDEGKEMENGHEDEVFDWERLLLLPLWLVPVASDVDAVGGGVVVGHFPLQ